MTAPRRTRIDPEQLAAGLRAGARADLARAITLVESTHPDDRPAARSLLSSLAGPAHPTTFTPDGRTLRVGISGVPGVGKSTFVERLGLLLIERGHRVGVLAVDPSSRRTGGSVLGDKTRMPALAAHPAAYVRPSPTSGTLGGVASSTAQSITVLEAAGFDVVLVETVGVGQSETAVATMVDAFLLLVLARSGDQLQGIKKGVLELADVVAVNKADGEHVAIARAAARELTGALHLVHPRGSGSIPPVLTCSALTGDGIAEVWERVLEHCSRLGPQALADRRADQRVELTWSLVRADLEQRLRVSGAVAALRGATERAVRAGELGAPEAADRIVAALLSDVS